MNLPLSDSPRPRGAPSRRRCRRRRWPAAAALAVGIAVGPTLLSGCSGSGHSSFLTGRPTVGQLKTSVAHLEFENAQMKRDLAKLRRENRQIEERLVQQESDNGELTARLDDARNLLRDRGVEPGDRAEAGPDGAHEPSDWGDGFRTVPAGQSNRKRRKPPVARIPGSISPAAPYREPADDPEDEDRLAPPRSSTAPASGGDSIGLRLDDPDVHSDYRGPLRWAPIAGRASDPASRMR